MRGLTRFPHKNHLRKAGLAAQFGGIANLDALLSFIIDVMPAWIQRAPGQITPGRASSGLHAKGKVY
jgi:hypothetical protein